MPHYNTEDGAPSYVPAGTYNFEVVEAVEKESARKNPMIALVLEIEGGARVYDYLVFDRTKKRCIEKINDFRRAIGHHIEPGNSDLEDHECVSQVGRVALMVGETNKGLKRNEVLKYISKIPTRTVTTAPDLSRESDDINF